MDLLSEEWRRNLRLLRELPHYGRKPARAYPGWDAFEYPDSSAVAAGRGDEHTPVAFCADVGPASLLAAYRRGLFPLAMPGSKRRIGTKLTYSRQVGCGAIAVVGPVLADRAAKRAAADPYWAEWWSPDPRPVLDVSAVHLGKNVRRRLRRLDLRTTANTAFKRIVEECRAERPSVWLTDELLSSLVALHEDGWAHSNEVWLGDELVGGSIGIGIGRVVSGDTVFGRMPEVARIAVADMAARLRAAGGQLIDAQVDSPLLRSIGASPVPRADYLKVLGSSAARVELDGTALPAQRLLPAADQEPAD
ncbi:MAG TPA: leucyl/phenylalanyl-tRNA--protein transferase [Trebonia sp.]|nr:leucyl/phenylalanyl-tRNA--protein transferase [Trebonia sp.]